MTGLLPKMTSGNWIYLKTKTVLAAAGLHTIKYYVHVPRASIMRWVVDMPILEIWRTAEKTRLYWWEQSMDLDEASAGAPAGVVTEGDRSEGRHPLATGRRPPLNTWRPPGATHAGSISWAGSSGPTYL